MNENIREKIGKRIAEIRKEKGISSYQLANITGLQRSNISRIENGKYSTSITVLEKIANALDCDIDFIKK